MTAQTTRRSRHARGDQGRADRSGWPRSGSAAIVPGLGTVLVGDDPGSHWYVGAKHKDCAEIGITSLPARPARHGDPGRGGGRDRRAQRRPGVHRLPRAAADRARRVRAAVAGRPRQGRRRAAPRQPRQAGARRARPAAVHAGRLRSSCCAATTSSIAGAEVVVVGRGITVGPPAGAAADAAYRERDGHPLPHRHPRPGRPRPQRRRRRRRGRGPRASSPATWSSPVPPCSTWASRGWTARSRATSTPRSGRSPAGCRPTPAGVGPMTRAMLLSNIVDDRRAVAGADRGRPTHRRDPDPARGAHPRRYPSTLGRRALPRRAARRGRRARWSC